ncbi:telomere length regulation protein-domain-containing protein [Radiomyces spectabilis]|uniref:telomere length regulation protein-domain-containing protein n=1 Tax=Radiomyces spectabilis TaxID=64574 RepID=UPI00221E4C47|nr:telomere length regulation protein-domain-containing protein [Radiomyces spectabilis]KAI8374520.1 telomere length regulation protein-domain-containing protein [Radiomyces spectabilis]
MPFDASSREFLERLIELKDKASLASESDLDSAFACLSEPTLRLTHLQPEQRLAVIHDIAWKRHVWFVLQKLVPQYSILLSPEHRHCLENLVTGTSDLDDQATWSLIQISLPILLECLQTSSGENIQSLDIYMRLLKRLVQPASVRLYMTTVQITDVRWFCTMLCSIPSRLANAFGLQQYQQQDESWYIDSQFYSALTRHLAQSMTVYWEHDGGKLLKPVETLSVFPGELLGKMFRQGYEDDCINTLYPIAVAQIQSHAQASPIWSAVLRRAETISTPDKVWKSLMNYIHDKVASQSEDALTISPAIITAWAAEAASLLFCTENMKSPSERRKRIEAFLTVTIFNLSKARWADGLTARLTVAVAVHAAGLVPVTTKDPQRPWQLSEMATVIVSKYTQRVIDMWTDPVFIKRASYQEHEYMTVDMLVLFGYLDNVRLYEIVNTTSIIPAVTQWFDTGSAENLKLGMTVGESLSSRMENNEAGISCKLLSDDDHQYLAMKALASSGDALAKAANISSSVTPTVEEPPSDEEDKGALEEDADLDPDALMVPSDDSEDSDLEPYYMEEESEDEEFAPKAERKKVKSPTYILDLVAYLKDRDDPVKLDIALGVAEQVIREKTAFGSEISESAIPLARYLIGLPTDYDLTDFTTRQQKALTALIVAVPQVVTSFMIDEIYSRTSSTAQRQTILAAILFAVRELAGWTEKEKMDETRQALDRMTIDTPVRVGQLKYHSRRAEVELKRQQGMQRNRLSGLAGPVFFFPLLVGWWEGAQRRMPWWIGNDEMLSERFIMTLNVIMHSATNTPDKRRIVMEYFEFALSMRYVPCSKAIKRALLLGLDIILNVSYKHQERLLLHDYTKELVDVKDWLQTILEAPDEEDHLKESAILLLSRLAHIASLE